MARNWIIGLVVAFFAGCGWAGSSDSYLMPKKDGGKVIIKPTTVGGTGSDVISVDSTTGVTVNGQTGIIGATSITGATSVTGAFTSTGDFTINGVQIGTSSGTDSTATKLGFYKYLGCKNGSTCPYNGGISPILTGTSGTTLNTVQRAVLIPYQMHDGTWRMKVNIAYTVSASAGGSTCTINGVTFKSLANFNQALAISGGDTGVAYAIQGGNSIGSGMSPAGTHFEFSGDVELESKPTWAY